MLPPTLGIEHGREASAFIEQREGVVLASL
jgi:hypothetical protein